MSRGQKMLQSMTAYGQSIVSSAHGDFAWEIRSVNHRYLDVGVRLPEGLKAIDARVRGSIDSRVHRGKVDVSLKFTGTSESAGRLVLDEQLLEQLSRAIDQVQNVRIDASGCDPVRLLQWPGLISVKAEIDDTIAESAMHAFEQALDDFIQARSREGRQIVQMLESRAVQISQLLEQLKAHRPTVVQRQREKLLAKLALLDIQHDCGRLEQELVYSAQRLDIDEELDRLGAHLQELANVVTRNEPTGRRLDFLMQEFNREANTVAAKSADSATTAIGIDMKVLIEQMREQVQNVE